MTLTNQIFDIYIDLNITLGLAVVLWVIAKHIGSRLGLKLAFPVQLSLLNTVLVLVFLSPLGVLAFAHLHSEGAVPAYMAVNLSDYAVSQYLRGGIALPAEEFQSLLGFRAWLTESIVTAAPGIGLGIAAAFAASVAFGIGKLFLSLTRLRRLLAESHHWRSHGRLVLKLSDTVATPFSARGIFKNYVVVPTEMLASPEDVKMVLKHEYQHIRQGDLVWEMVLEIVRPLFFWNPAFFYWKQEVETIRELACDQAVAERRGVDLKSYCMCLLRAAEFGVRRRQEQLGGKRVAIATVALLDVHKRLFRKSPANKLRSRVEALLETRSLRPHWSVLALVVLPVAGVILMAGVALQKPADWSQDRLMLSAIINLERLETINTLAQRPD
ncbi:M56 family metallopeptidase [Roseibium denhamense]|uniref:BlaR1 peptidase M56 n=1 Tax=Roseibium denhamense TaxID=76305 RepID=A0ABY1NH28_9HYPH|nr:M56 family metallopeptidase [Roseibium denhamense]MTI06501.1 M56 family metallopeptidase [Roseibium denhamense]SMP09618.1 BlaR1 peptidase M56 [Roseibium denhamense]